MSGFFLEHNGKPSMVRLLAFMLTLTTVVAVILGRDAATMATLVGGGVVALMTRTKLPKGSPAPDEIPAKDEVPHVG